MLIYAECGQYFLTPGEHDLIIRLRSTDHLTSRHSTAPFDVNETKDYISIIDRIKGASR
jgi:hypothetical protein